MDRRFAGSNLDASWGERRDHLLPAPGAGLEWSMLLAGGSQYRLLFAAVTFTASAVVANRFPAFQVKDGDGNVRLQSADPGAVVAAKAVSVSYAIGLATTAGGSGTSITIGTPDVLLDAGWSIGSVTPGLDVGDTYGPVRLLLEELVDDYPGHAAGHRRHPHLEIELEGAMHHG